MRKLANFTMLVALIMLVISLLMMFTVITTNDRVFLLTLMGAFIVCFVGCFLHEYTTQWYSVEMKRRRIDHLKHLVFGIAVSLFAWILLFINLK